MPPKILKTPDLFRLKKVEKQKTWWQRNVSEQWTKYVALPFGNFISRNFGKKTETSLTSAGLAGNAGIIAVKLNKKPERGKETI